MLLAGEMGIKLDTVVEVREEVRLMSLSDDELAALFLSPSRLQMLSDEDLDGGPAHRLQ